MLATFGLALFIAGSAVSTWAEIAGLCLPRPRRTIPAGLFRGE